MIDIPKHGSGSAEARAYRVTFRGDSYVYHARSRSAARYASWRALREAGYRMDLPTFAGLARVQSEPPITPHATRTEEA